MNFTRISVLPAVVFLGGLAAAAPQNTEWKMANGLEVLHIHRPSSKVLASIVTVNVGSKDESAETNGLSHLLEHMVFDGTARRTRADINEGSKRYGGWVNATTRTSFTSYISVFPADYAEISLDLQADMLFNSTIPAQELEKERKVVIEEMKRDRDAALNNSSEHHDALLFAGTPYARPVLGFENTITAVPRAAVLDYYRRHYVPSHMRALIVSPFSDTEVRKWMEKTFGAAVGRQAVPAIAPPWSFPKSGTPTYKEDAVNAAYVHISLPAPALGDPDFFAFDLLTRYLAEGGASPLQRSVRRGKPPLADSLTAALETEISFSVWKITVMTQSSQVPEALETLRRALQSAALAGIPDEELIRLQRQVQSQEATTWEQPHYFGLFKAAMINAQGFPFTLSYPPKLRAVTASEVLRVADRYFSKPIFFCTAVVPKGKMPPSESTAESHSWRKEVLPNGLTLVAQGSDESDVFALSVLTRNRSALEPVDAEGISDFVQRMLLSGTGTRTNEAIQKELDRISAQIQYVDNPFIPYDDHYTSSRFTFFRLEALDEMRRPALDLIADCVSQSIFPDAEVEKVRQEILRLQLREMDSSAKRATQRLREVLLSSTPYARAVLGRDASVSKITRSQLQEHFKRLYAPSNMVVLAVGKGTTGGVMRELKARFENLKGTTNEVTASSPTPRISFSAEQIAAEKQQTQLTAGTLTVGWGVPDGAAMRVLNAILSERLAVELRETQGLAYSVASELQQEKDYGWIEIRMGTRNEAADQARKGILDVISSLAAGNISADERERAVNGIWGSMLRQRLPRIGQAFYRGIDEVRSSGYDAEERLLPALRAVRLEDLQQIAKEAMNTERWLLISVGK